MVHDRLRRQNGLRKSAVLLLSFAFFSATNYCMLETLAAHPTHGGNSHHSDASDHPGEKGFPTSGNDQDALCCATLHAVLPSKSDIHPVRPITGILQLAVLGPSKSSVLVQPSRSAIGWSPPEREPPPAAAFYRTTYANHAPPVCLA